MAGLWTDDAHPRIAVAQQACEQSRFAYRIDWEFFGEHDLNGLVCAVAAMVDSKCLPVFYVGLASLPLRRFEGDESIAMEGHHVRFECMWPLALASTTHARWLERAMLNKLGGDPRCQNKSRGGERLASPYDTIFIYFCGSFTLNRDNW